MTDRKFQPELPSVTGEEIQHMSEENLKKFVDDLVSGRIFTSAQINDADMIGMVFMPLVLGALRGWSDTGLANIGVVWEYLDRAGPMSVNGYPAFFSMRLIHIDDWKIAVEAARKEAERRKNIEL